jgi:hypothetical protein
MMTSEVTMILGRLMQELGRTMTEKTAMGFAEGLLCHHPAVSQEAQQFLNSAADLILHDKSLAGELARERARRAAVKRSLKVVGGGKK